MEDASPGIEVYYRSPSFLLTAGGSFLNSGYGHDEIDVPGVNRFEQTSRAQATTLIPTRAETRFHDLIRFEPYPDPPVDPYADDPEDPDTLHTLAVARGVHRGIIAGANLRPAERKIVLEQSTSEAPALASHDGRLLVAWKGSGNHALNVAKALTTTVLGIDGVEGVEDNSIQGATSDRSPALVSHLGRVFLAWRGLGNKKLNLAFSHDGGKTFAGTKTLLDSSDHAPALVSHGGGLLLAWTGRGNEKLNVAEIVVFANTAGGFGIEGIENQVVLKDTSSNGPALASNEGRLFLAWKGSGNHALNVSFSEDGGKSFRPTATSLETSSHRPSLASHAGSLFVAWKGSDNDQLNVARVVHRAGASGIELDGKVMLPEKSTEPPALASDGGLLLVAWKDPEDDNLGLRVSRDGTFRTPGPWIFRRLSRLGIYFAAYRSPVALGDLDGPPDNLGFVYAREAEGMDFETFRRLTLERNRDLPTELEYGSYYEFLPPDGGRFLVSFQLTGDSLKPRVVDLDDPIDFGTLPLVSGPWLNAPGGHDGLIEIRDPRCPTVPVVLDFRTADAPGRVDNLAACPQPWVDRARALLDLAERRSEMGDYIGALHALVDRVDVFGQLATADPIFWSSVVASWAALAQLASQLANNGRPAEAVAVQEALVEVLAAFTPTPDQELEAAIMLAEARHNLVARLIEAGRADEAGALVGAAIAAYRHYTAISGADILRVGRSLAQLASQLANNGRPAEAVAVQEAAQDLGVGQP